MDYGRNVARWTSMASAIFLPTGFGLHFFCRESFGKHELFQEIPKGECHRDVNQNLLQNFHGLMNQLIGDKGYKIRKNAHESQLDGRPLPRIRLPLNNGQGAHTLHGKGVEQEE